MWHRCVWVSCAGLNVAPNAKVDVQHKKNTCKVKSSVV